MSNWEVSVREEFSTTYNINADKQKNAERDVKNGKGTVVSSSKVKIISSKKLSD